MFLLEGRLQAIDFTLDGREVGLHFIEEGQYFGEISVLDGLPSPEVVIATKKSQVVMVPDSEMYGSLFQQLEYNYQRPVYEYTTPPELASVTTMQPLTRQQVFPWPQGYFVLNDDLLGVNYQHDFSAGQQGRLKLTAITAQNSAGELIPLQLRSQRLYTYANDDGFVKSSQQNLLVGWNEPDELMNDVAQLRADAGFYPAELITLRIKPDPANTVTVSEGELTVTLSPVPDEPQTYKLTASGNERYQLLQRYDGAEGAIISYPGAQFSGPDWLTEDERNALDLVMAPHYNDAQNVTIFQFKQVPAELSEKVKQALASQATATPA